MADAAIDLLTADYTREAGVRNLEREIGKVLRKVTTKLDTKKSEGPLKVDTADIKDYLGRPKFQNEVAERTSVPGVATGLAVTGTGGDVLFIEASALDGEVGALTRTRQPRGIPVGGQFGPDTSTEGSVVLRDLAYPGLIDLTPEAVHVLEACRSAGGRPLIVGGSVRDALISRTLGERIAPKDIDTKRFEVFLRIVRRNFGAARPHSLKNCFENELRLLSLQPPLF